MLNETDTLYYIGVLLAVAMSLQSLELLTLKKSYADDGIWAWTDLRKEYGNTPRFFAYLLDRIMPAGRFSAIIVLRFISALAIPIFPHAFFFAYLYLSTLLISLRWRGTFNGGSDCMSLILLLSMTLASIDEIHPLALKGCLWFIALQSVNSYLIAGVVKLKSANWRDGTALPLFLKASCHKVPVLLSRLFKHKTIVVLASWSVILFECTFPLALLHPILCIGYCSLGLTFHLANAYLLGLNRFFWIWAASYPAILYCSGYFMPR